MELKLKYSKWIPWGNYYAVTIFNNLYRRDRYKNKPISKTTYNHESIHLQQELDFVFGCEKLYVLGGIIFYIWYFIDWLIKFLIAICTINTVKAYRSICFEQEAYSNQNNLSYLTNRKRFCWLKNIFKVVTE